MMSEEAVAGRFKNLKSASRLPHWEHIWTAEYCLDRLHQYRLRGNSIHFRSLIKIDPPLAVKIYREFESYDQALEMIGLRPEEIRQLEHRSWNRENILETLKERAREDGSFGIVAMKTEFGGLIRAAIEIFGSYEKALKLAGIDPAAVLERRPRLSTSHFEKLEAQARKIGEAKRDPRRIAAFHKKYGMHIQSHYGSYSNLAAALKIPVDHLILGLSSRTKSQRKKVGRNKNARLKVLKKQARLGAQAS